jgi:hypothetical protein
MITKHHILFLAPLLAFALILVSISCKKNPTGPVIPPDDRPIMSATDYARINLNMVDYDVVHITQQLGLTLRSTTIARIAIGSKGNTGFQQYLSVPDTFSPNANAYIIHYDFTVLMDRKQTVAPLTIRYIAADSSYIDVDTSVALYKYPYSNAQIVTDRSILPDPLSPFQDISRIGSTLFFHPIGPFGLYSFDLNTKTVRDLYDYSSGDQIAADSNYVFCDVNSDGLIIARYNTSTDAVDLKFPFFDNFGMAVLNGYLFVVDGVNGYMKKYTRSGALTDSVAYSNQPYYLAIYDSVAYGVLWTSPSTAFQITRFDLRTKQFLSNLYSPAFACEGITVFADSLYYCDYGKTIVGAVPISDLKVISSNTSVMNPQGRAPNQSLKLTAEAEVQSRNARKMDH